MSQALESRYIITNTLSSTKFNIVTRSFKKKKVKQTSAIVKAIMFLFWSP